MFNKLKHLKDLRSQAKTMQDVLSTEIITTEKNGILIKMNGNMEIIDIEIDENIPKDAISRNLVDGLNETIKKTQRIMAQKMQEMGGIPGLNQ